MNDLINQQLLGNSLSSWLIAFATALGLFIVIYFFKMIFISRARRWSALTATDWDNFIVEMIEKSVVPSLFAAGIYYAVSSLRLSPKVEKVSGVLFLGAMTFFVLRILSAALRKFIYSFIKVKDNSGAKEKQASGLILILNIVLWMFGIIFMIDNFGYNVTSLIAGLGIGGIAIALAAQTVLGDLFSYFVIFFDRPFEIGDFVVIDDKSGNIEQIGIKTTRIRTLGGEQLVCSNTDLTNARLHNYKRLQKRRVLFNLGVTYQTSHEKLSEIPQILKTVIQSKENVEFDRAHFSGYGDFSLNFEIVYYLLDPDYTMHMDKQQEIYLHIYQAFEREGIEFAYPTQTLLLHAESGIAS